MHRSPFSRNRNRRVLPPVPQHHEPETSSKTSGSSLDMNDKPGNQEFYPSMEDVLDVRDLLRRMRPSAHGTVPDEIVDMIIDEAEYWPSVVTSLNTTPLMISADGDKECLRTPPLCFSFNEGEENTPKTLLHRGMYPCRKIVFDISSHDQGWGGNHGHQGTFRGSYTWFDTYIIPSNKKNSTDGEEGGQESVSTETGEDATSGPYPMKPFLPGSTKLQCNRTATKVPTNYHIVWHYKDSIQQDSSEAERIEEEEGRGRATLDGESVRAMQIGDQLVVWMRARFAAWRNNVDSMSHPSSLYWFHPSLHPQREYLFETNFDHQRNIFRLSSSAKHHHQTLKDVDVKMENFYYFPNQTSVIAHNIRGIYMIYPDLQARYQTIVRQRTTLSAFEIWVALARLYFNPGSGFTRTCRIRQRVGGGMSIDISRSETLLNVITISVLPTYHDYPSQDMWKEAIALDAKRLTNLQFYHDDYQGRFLYSIIVIGRFVRAFLLCPCGPISPVTYVTPEMLESGATYVRPLELWHDEELIHDLLERCVWGIGFS